MILDAAQNVINRLRESWCKRAILFKAINFGLIGLVNTAIDFGIFLFAYYHLGLPIIVANLFSWVFAVSSSYVLNSMITFATESRRELSARTYATFVLAQIAGFAANTTTVVAASIFMPVLVGKVLSIGVGFLVNFLLSHFVVFRRRADETPGYK
jgi:putative flippase GtrA